MKFLKQILTMCRKDVYYTLFFTALLYITIYTLLVMVGFADIEHRVRGYHVSFIVCKWLIFISAGLTTYKIFKENNKLNSIFVFGCITVIYNTLFKIPFDESQWFWAMVLTSLIYLHYSVIFFFSGKHSEVCCVCKTKPQFSKLYRINIFKGGFKKGDIHYDGETYICQKCMDKCQKCDSCGHLIMTDEIKESLDDWKTIDFCYCNK